MPKINMRGEDKDGKVNVMTREISTSIGFHFQQFYLSIFLLSTIIKKITSSGLDPDL
jgi:hypothetical protein